MDRLTATGPVTRLEVVDTGRRRRWSREVKLRIVEESFSAPRQVSATARRHGISNQLLFFWRKAYREGRLGDGSVRGFVPVQVMAEQRENGAEAVSGRIEVVTANGRRLIVGRDVDLVALLRIIQSLETLR